MNDIIYIGFWKRFIGFLVNSLILALMLAPVGHLMFTNINSSGDSTDEQQGTIDQLNIMVHQSSIEFAIAAVVFLLFWIFRNSEPGKMIFSAVIVDADSHHSPSKGQYLIRYLAYYISLLPLGLGFLWIAFDDRKQGWHDKIAGTVVIKKNQSPLQP